MKTVRASQKGPLYGDSLLLCFSKVALAEATNLIFNPCCPSIELLESFHKHVAGI